MNVCVNQKVKCIEIETRDKVNMYYGIDILSQFVEILNKFTFDKVFFISEENIYKIHGQKFFNELQKNGINVHLILTGGREEDKTFTNLGKICNYMIEQKISKDSLIIGFGGGVVGNISGLAAGLIYRGIRYIEIPTTFMGQTDSSLSNKQAVNGDSGKNQLGMYHAPIFLWADLKYIATEQIRHINAAIVEGVKNTFIHDLEFRDTLASFIRNKKEYTLDEIYYLFESITKSKNKILKIDPGERKYAVILEYGHTFGHAIEFLTKGKIIHGEAVEIGMCIAAEVSHAVGGLQSVDVDLHYEILSPFIEQISVELLRSLNSERIYEAIQNDNKRTSSGVKYVLLEKMGKCMNTEGDCQVHVDKDVILKSIDKTLTRILT